MRDGGRRRRPGAATAAGATVLAAVAAFLALVVAPAPGWAGGAWTLALRDSVAVAGPRVRLGDVAEGPLPPRAAALVLGSGGPGRTLRLTAKGILRRLVTAGLAAEVRLAGAERCRVRLGGRPVAAGPVRERVEALLGERLPAGPPGAPASWLELELAPPRLTAAGSWTVELLGSEPLRPGRNLVGVAVTAGERRTRLSATVTCHVYGETAVATGAVRREEALAPDRFAWSWRDLADGTDGLLVGRERLTGCCATRDLAPGDELRESDLRPIPLVRRGEPVELVIRRGGVAVSVTAEARQDGRLGQVVSVRNSLNGEVVAGRVAGPGRVEWRRR